MCGLTMSINDWPEDQRPREKLLSLGAAALSDAELLAVMLRTGARGKNAIHFGQELINAFGGLAGLFSASAKALQTFSGLGPAKAVQLLALRELAGRILAGEMRAGPQLSDPSAVRDYLRLSLMGRQREVFTVVFLDAQHRVLRVEELFAGTLTQTSVYPREVVRKALEYNAAAVIFAHNHPSGVADPSRADEQLTRTLQHALALVDIRVLDHLIVAGPRALSFAERGLL